MSGWWRRIQLGKGSSSESGVGGFGCAAGVDVDVAGPSDSTSLGSKAQAHHTRASSGSGSSSYDVELLGVPFGAAPSPSGARKGNVFKRGVGTDCGFHIIAVSGGIISDTRASSLKGFNGVEHAVTTQCNVADQAQVREQLSSSCMPLEVPWRNKTTGPAISLDTGRPFTHSGMVKKRVFKLPKPRWYHFSSTTMPSPAEDSLTIRNTAWFAS